MGAGASLLQDELTREEAKALVPESKWDDGWDANFAEGKRVARELAERVWNDKYPRLRGGAGPGRAVVDGAPARLGAAARVGEEVDLVGADAGAVGPQQLRQRRRAALLHAGDAKVQGGVRGER